MSKKTKLNLLIIFQKAAFEHASVCLFVFDCLLYNGKSLLDKYCFFINVK